MARVRVKMCGMTRSEDIAHAIHLGVDAIGLIFYPQSARYVSVEQATHLLKDLPALVTVVAVLVNPEPDLVYKIIDALPIQLLQFQGDESLEFCQQFNKPFIKAIQCVSTEQIVQAAQEFKAACALLLDTPANLSRGGTGNTFNWKIIPSNLDKPLILAGGLNESNVVDAINLCHPYAVDLCSGIENSPGIKDHTKMNHFMQKLFN